MKNVMVLIFFSFFVLYLSTVTLASDFKETGADVKNGEGSTIDQNGEHGTNQGEIK